MSTYFRTLEEIGRSNAGETLLTGTARRSRTGDAHKGGLDRRYRLRVDQIVRQLAKGPATVRDLVTAIFPRVKTLNVFLAFSEILGFLMYLEDEGRVEKVVEETRDRYRLVA